MIEAFITGVATPVCVFVLMFCVGFEMRRHELFCIFKQPGILIAGSLIQALTAPSAALVTVLVLELSPQMALAIVLLAISPGGALSNAYCYLANLNTALSVSLTVLGSVLSILTFPIFGELLLGLLDMAGIRTAAFPHFEIFMQLAFFVLLPVLFGLALRNMLREKYPYLPLLFRRTGLMLLIAVVGMSVVAKSVDLHQAIETGWLAATVFMCMTMAASLFLARLFAREEAYVIAIELSVRNIPVALLISSQLLDKSMIGYFLCYLLVQFILLLAVTYSLGTKRSAKT